MSYDKSKIKNTDDSFFFFVHLFARPRPNLSFTTPPPPDTVRPGPGKTWSNVARVQCLSSIGRRTRRDARRPISNDDNHWLAETIRTTVTTKTDKREKKHLSRKTLTSGIRVPEKLVFRYGAQCGTDSAGFYYTTFGARVCRNCFYSTAIHRVSINSSLRNVERTSASCSKEIQ